MQPETGDANSKVSRHLLIAEALRNELRQNMQPGDRLEGERAIADRFHASMFTVREALSALAAEGLIERRRGSGTFMANPTSRQHVAVVLGVDIAHPRLSYFYRRAVQIICQELDRAGLQSRLYCGRSQLEAGSNNRVHSRALWSEITQDYQAGRILGIIELAGVLPKPKELDLPYVGTYSPSQVVTDYAGMVREGLRYLAEHGRSRVAVLGWPDIAVGPAGDNVTALTRLIQQAGLTTRREWVRCDLNPNIPGAGWQEMVEVWAASRHRPQGILICDDMLFSDASKAILALQIRVPEDLLVVTHANKGSDVWAPFPALKLEFDPDEYARTQVELFLSERQRQPGRPSQRIVLPFRQAHQTDQYLDRVEHYAGKLTEG